MSHVFPVQAFRYSANSKIDSLLCPPYDVIHNALAKKLGKNPYNAIQIELPHGSGTQKYVKAKRCWGNWRQKGIVIKDLEPAFYVLEHSFEINGKNYKRLGFFCEVKLERPGHGSILRHELTLPKPKKDRLELLRKIRVNTSPILGLFEDKKGVVSEILINIKKQKPLVQFKNGDNEKQKLWNCSSVKLIRKIQGILQKSEIIIADGHHRYETAWQYFQEQKPGLHGASRVLFFLCSMQEAGVMILPTHRVINSTGRGGAAFIKLLNRLKSLSNIFKFQGFPLSNSIPPACSFLMTNGKKACAVSIRSFGKLKRIFPGYSVNYLKLSLFHLHTLLLPELSKESFFYTHDKEEALRIAAEKDSVAFLVSPVSVQKLYAVVKNRELMPQKSTYFYPKVTTGIIFRSLV